MHTNDLLAIAAIGRGADRIEGRTTISFAQMAIPDGFDCIVVVYVYRSDVNKIAELSDFEIGGRI